MLEVEPTGDRDCETVGIPPLMSRKTLGILLFIAGRGRKAYWKRGVGGEGERGGANTIAGCMPR